MIYFVVSSLLSVKFINYDLCVTLCKEMQDSLGFWISRRGFRIPDNKFRIVTGTWIPDFNR